MMENAELALSARCRIEWLDCKHEMELDAFAEATFEKIWQEYMVDYARDLMEKARNMPSVCYASLPPGMRKDLAKVMRMMGSPAVAGRSLDACRDAKRIAWALKPEFDGVIKLICWKCEQTMNVHHKQHGLQRTLVKQKDLVRRKIKAEAAQAGNSDALAEALELFKMLQVQRKIQDGEIPALEDYPSDAPFHGFKPESEWGRLYEEVIRHLAACNELLDESISPPSRHRLKMARLQLLRAGICLKRVDALPAPEGGERETVKRILKQLGSVEELESRLKTFEQAQGLNVGSKAGQAVAAGKYVKSGREKRVSFDAIESVANAADKDDGAVGSEPAAVEERADVAREAEGEEEGEVEVIEVYDPEDEAELARLNQDPDWPRNRFESGKPGPCSAGE